MNTAPQSAVKPSHLIGGGLVVITASLVSVPSPACSPPQPGLFGTVPSDGMSYPANGRILFSGYGIALTDVTVSVDGMPAALAEPEPGDALLGMADRVASVVPEPMPGQTVIVSGTFCQDGGENCAPPSFSFVAGDRDSQAPSAEGLFDITYDVHDHPQHEPIGGSCEMSSGVHFYIHVATQMTGHNPDGSLTPGTTPEYWIVTGTSTGAAAPAFREVIPVVDANLDLVVALDDATVVDAPTTCIDVALVDAAGNVLGETASSCAACMFRNDDDGSSSPDAFEEPVWTTADVYPDGDCSPAHEPPVDPPSTEDQTVGGCACKTSRSTQSPGWPLWLLGAAILRRRRDRI